MIDTTEMNEHTIQTLAVSYLRARLEEPFLIYSVPNGGKREKGTAVKLKAEGVLSGIPDLHIPIAKRGFHSLYIEVKKKGGSLSKNQKDMIVKLKKLGHKVEVCYSYTEIVQTVINYYDPSVMPLSIRELEK